MQRILFLFLLISQCAFGQFFVVKDKDGYVNIREKESVKSKILGTLPNNKLVYIFHADEDISKWHYIDKGYIHNSRLKPTYTFLSIKKEKESDNAITFSGMGIRVELTAQKYDKKKHVFTKENKGDHYEYKIDGKPFEGTDGSEPETEYKSFVVSINGKQVTIPKSAYRDMYVPAFSETSVYYDKEDDIIYIEAQNGTGAGGYDVCWQIVKGVYKTREVGYFN